MIPLTILMTLTMLMMVMTSVRGANILILHPLYAGSHDLVLRWEPNFYQIKKLMIFLEDLSATDSFHVATLSHKSGKIECHHE